MQLELNERDAALLSFALRSRIEEDPAHPRFLQTVRSVGYVLRLDEA